MIGPSVLTAEWIRKHPDGSVEEHHTDPGALILKSTPLLAAAFVGAIAIGMSGGGTLKPTVTIGGGGGGGAGDSVDWQANWLAFSDTAPNDSIIGMAIPASNAADSAALYDFGNWDTEMSNGDRDTLVRLVPVASAPGSWPSNMGHVARVQLLDTAPAFQYGTDGVIPAPSIGEYTFKRFYFSLVADSGFNPNDTHFFHNGNNAEPSEYATWWEFDILEQLPLGITGDSLYRVQLLLNVNDAPSSGFVLGYMNADSLKTHQVYMAEERLYYHGTDTARTDAKIWEVNGDTHTLLFDTDDWRFECFNNGSTECDSNPLPGEVNVHIPNTGHFTRIETGYNGAAVQPVVGPWYMYLGGYAARTTSDSSLWIDAFCTPSNECN